ncbi:hypothetical protein LTR50_001861 [Elasticomyces elasticus]|nr:hypothetical protein LTR50_001861 [Elasticomyces elasticus]
MAMPDNQSYLSAGMNILSPWGSRSPVMKPSQEQIDKKNPAEARTSCQRGGDHKIGNRHRLSLRKYPRDCPALKVQWFHAIDVPKRRPIPGRVDSPAKTEKPAAAPKKYSPFSENDSLSIETTFQKLAEEEDAVERKELDHDDDVAEVDLNKDRAQARVEGAWPPKTSVPVNEDFLFDVDVEARELAPAYWLGPVYDVRRGTWFFQEGSVLKPCDENLAIQLEEGYLKVRPWRLSTAQKHRSTSQPRSQLVPLKPSQESSSILKTVSTPVTPKASRDDLRATDIAAGTKSSDSKPEHAGETAFSNTHRLFGAHMNSVVTYQDGTTAWLLTDDFMSRMSSSMYQRFAGGGHFAGMKVIRGYTDPLIKPEGKDGKIEVTSREEPNGDRRDIALDTNPVLASQENNARDQACSEIPESLSTVISPASETRRQTLERHMSSLVASTTKEDPAQQEEEVRKRDEKEIQDDYKEQEGDRQGREIEHLLLVTHGIGQRLGLRMESVNFVHDVNTLRKSLKAVYAESSDLQALNSEVDKMPKNCRIQVLPICWRHLLDFPKQSLKHNREEHDLGEAGYNEEEDYPNLDDISVEGVPAVRNLITDLALDILLYQSPAYKDHISRIVLEECNRIYHLFMQRNSSFHGRISLIGHSLGSAIMFDILCRQEEDGKMEQKGSVKHLRKHQHTRKLEFEVEDFYALGSPIGLFQMLKGRTIAARNLVENEPGITHPEKPEDPFSPPGLSKPDPATGATTSEIPVSSPKCRQVFNIFHPTDPISYRIEPLISPVMASLKPQPLPYTKRGIFGAPVGQGLTGIGTRVGQSVSGLWSSLSSGIASSLLNRSLGISAEDSGKLGSSAAAQQSRGPLSLITSNNAAGGTIPGGMVATATARIIEEQRRRNLAHDTIEAGEAGQHPPTLIDAELETLYGGFQKRRKSVQSDADSRELGESAQWQEAEERGRKLRREEAKVRALNTNGRVDYSIQE